MVSLSSRRVAVTAALGLALVLMVLLDAAADAQTGLAQSSTPAPDEAPVAEVIITGSRIKRADAVTAQNVQVISGTEILNSGQETLADYLRTISSTFGNSFNEGSDTDSFAPVLPPSDCAG